MKIIIMKKTIETGGGKYWNKLLWQFTDWFCPSCGKKVVYECPKVDEDNAGHQHVCVACGYTFMHHEGNYQDVSNETIDELMKKAMAK